VVSLLVQEGLVAVLVYLGRVVTELAVAVLLLLAAVVVQEVLRVSKELQQVQRVALVVIMAAAVVVAELLDAL
jgi:hypothetical protein